MQHLWSVTIQRPSSGIVALEVVDSLRPAGVLLVEVPHGVVVVEEEVGELPNILIHVQLGSVSSLLAPKIKSRPNPVKVQTCSKSSNFYDLSAKMRILLNLIFGHTYTTMITRAV